MVLNLSQNLPDKNYVQFCQVNVPQLIDTTHLGVVAFAEAGKSIVKSKSNLTNNDWLYKMTGN